MLIDTGIYKAGKNLYVDHRARKKLLKKLKAHKINIPTYCYKLENLKSAEWRKKGDDNE